MGCEISFKVLIYFVFLPDSETFWHFTRSILRYIFMYRLCLFALQRNYCTTLLIDFFFTYITYFWNSNLYLLNFQLEVDVISRTEKHIVILVYLAIIFNAPTAVNIQQVLAKQLYQSNSLLNYKLCFHACLNFFL